MCAPLFSSALQAQIKYPHTPKVDTVDTYFGTQVKDPYRWLEDDRAPETEAWVKEQNTITYNYLEKIPYRDSIRQRLTELNNFVKYSSPFKKNGVYYFFLNEGLQNQSVLYRQTTLEATPEVVLDPNTLSDDGTVALSLISISNDGKYMAYSIARAGSDWNEIYVMDLHTKKILPDHIKWVKFSGIAWHNDGFYYSAYQAPKDGDELSGRNEYHKVFFHKINTNQEQDKLIFENPQHPLRNVSTVTTQDEKYLLVFETESTSGNSLQIKSLLADNTPFISLVNNFSNNYRYVGDYQGKIYILTDWKAPKKRLMEIDPLSPQQANWKEIIAETDNVLATVSIVGGHFIATYMQDAISKATVFNLSGEKLHDISLPGLGTVGAFNGEKDNNEAFFLFTSYTVPPTIYRYNVANNQTSLFRKPNLKFDADQFVAQQIFYTSKDGTRIPMTIIHKKGIKRNGKNPVMLYGYGGFNISLNPSFSAGRLPFLEQGGIYAIANLRGGGEYGEQWHKAGTKLQKQNVFDDFIAAAEYLIKEKYTSPKHLAINGGSNGGLLVGATLTQRPDLIAVAIPEVGVLDMLRYQYFTIGWAWATDYGTSNDSPEMFRYLYGYSPLHNIKKGVTYPATMVMTGDHDDRVVPAHSFKFIATLQEQNKSKHPTLIRIDINAGHGAGKPISKVIDAQTDMWTFVMHNLKMKVKF